MVDVSRLYLLIFMIAQAGHLEMLLGIRNVMRSVVHEPPPKTAIVRWTPRYLLLCNA